jgi:hypothetical protein
VAPLTAIRKNSMRTLLIMAKAVPRDGVPGCPEVAQMA